MIGKKKRPEQRISPQILYGDTNNISIIFGVSLFHSF